MGANISTVVNRAVSTIDTASKASCKNFQQVDQSIKGINVKLVGASCGDITIANKAAMSADCNLDQLASALASASMELSVQQSNGLALPGSVNISTAVADRTQVIKQRLEQDCGSNQLIKQTIEGATVELYPDPINGTQASCKSLSIINDSNLTTQCAIKSISSALAKLEDKIKVEQSNAISPWALLAIFVPLLIFIGVLYFIFRKKPTGPGGPPRKMPPPGRKGAPPLGQAPKPPTSSFIPSGDTLRGAADFARSLRRK